MNLLNFNMTLQKIAIVAPDNIGDLLLCTPAIRAIRKGFPQAGITLFLSPLNQPIFEGNPDVDEIVVTERLPFIKYLKWALELRKRDFNLVVCLPANVRKYFLSFLLGRKERIGCFYKKMWVGSLLGKIFLTKTVSSADDPGETTRKKLKVKHELEQYLEIPAALGLSTEERDIIFYLDEEDNHFADDFLLKSRIKKEEFLLGIQYSERWFDDETRKEYFSLLLQKIRENFPSWKIIILYARPEEAKDLEKIFCEIGINQNILAAGELSLKKWAALIKRCSLFLSMEGGGPIMAGALRVPVVAIYFSLYYEYLIQKWYPWGAPYRLLRNPDYLRCSGKEKKIASQKLIEAIIKEIRGIS